MSLKFDPREFAESQQKLTEEVLVPPSIAEVKNTPHQLPTKSYTMSIPAVTILASAILVVGLAYCGILFFKPEYEAVAASGKPWIFVVNKASGDAKLCGPNKCVRVKNQNSVVANPNP